MNTFRILAISSLAVVAILGCQRKAEQVETTLYFGQSRPDGSLIPDSSWKRFTQEEILPLFPEGFTVLTAQGVWKGSTGTVEEASKVVVFIHPKIDSLSDKIDSLRKRYMDEFNQDAVLRTDDELEHLDLR